MDIKIRVTTGSNKRRIVQGDGGELRVYVKEPPVKGKANDELKGMLAKHFKVAKSEIEIIKGKNSRNKIIRVDGL